MEENGYFHPNHHGFRGARSTTPALLQLYNSWLKDVDNQQLVGACLIDLAAAFDVANVDLLVTKLGLYGWSRHAQQLAWSYMTSRSQRIYLEGSLSQERKLSHGVPKGTILGQLFYIILTNEFPEVIHSEDCPEKLNAPNNPNISQEWKIKLHTSCKSCGSTIIYADNSTYSTSKDTPEELAITLSEKYTIMANYLSLSGLKINDNNTHTMLLTTSLMRRSRDIRMEVRTGEDVGEASEVEPLLGIHIQQDIKWSDTVMYNQKSLIKALQTRTKALMMISRVADFQTRKMIANGI
jgi:hypothetical protein